MNMQYVHQKLASYLNGHDPSPDPAIYSWASHAIYLEACRIAEIGSLSGRRAAIESLPDTIRERVKEELRRIWK
jgi:hypothetical protein